MRKHLLDDIHEAATIIKNLHPENTQTYILARLIRLNVAQLLGLELKEKDGPERPG